MRIDEADLDGFASELVAKCLNTRRDRIQVYSGFKHYFLFGAGEGEQAPYNKLYPHMDLLTAYLYAQSSVEFDITAENQPDVIAAQAELVTKRINIKFHKCGIADLFSDALQWALIFNSTVMKINWSRGKYVPYMIEPHNFGVLREDVNNLNRQEAFVHVYRISRDELRRRIMQLPNAADVMRRVSTSPVPDESAFPEPVNRLLIAGTAAMTTGITRGVVNMPDLLNQMAYRPQGVDDTVEMFELWVWDDQKEDYRTITIAEPGVVIYGRQMIGNLLGIKGKHPFVHICPNRLYDYFWGWSEITNLIKLQDWLSIRLREIRQILSKQADPPKSLSGFQGLVDEKIAALSYPGSWISESAPGAKVDLLAPSVPDDLFQDLMLIQAMFNDESGLSDVLQGKGETNVRTKGQTGMLARLGASRIKKRALSIERSLEAIGELMVDIMMKKDDKKFTMLDGKQFGPGQFTEDYQCVVDAHSASPVFVEDHTTLAFALAKAGAIDPDSLLELTKPPRVETLRQRYKAIKADREAKLKQMMAAGINPKTMKSAA